jgi:tRNA(fMet)-specific endonuclease VapC
MAVLDTSFLIDLMRSNKDAVALLDDLEHKEHALFIPASAAMELWSGALQSNLKEKEKQKVKDLLDTHDFLSLDKNASLRAGEVEAILMKTGSPLQMEDMQIAGIALASGETVVTRDSGYTKVPGLRVLIY